MSGLIGSSGSKSGLIRREGPSLIEGYHQSQFGWRYIDGCNEDGTYITKDGVNLAVDDVYGGLVLLVQGIPVRAKYFEFGFDYKGHSGTNHHGCFWGNTDIDRVFQGSATGYRTTQPSSSVMNIRDNLTNSDQTSYNPGFAPNDNVWHHQRVIAQTTGTLYVWVDGSQRMSGSYIPADPGMVGFVGYEGTVTLTYKNISFRILD